MRTPELTWATLLAACLLAAGCASGKAYDADREWRRAECQRILDDEARRRCLRRLDEE